MEIYVDLSRFENRVNRVSPIKLRGKVLRVTGLLIESEGPPASIGELCMIYVNPEKSIMAEVVGFNGDVYLLMPYGSMQGITPGCEITATGGSLRIPLDASLKGRILNGLGEPIDGKDDFGEWERHSILRTGPHPLKRGNIDQKLHVGVKAIDGCLTLAAGQRIGIFSGSGVGKSTLLGMMARGSDADVNVIALIGERGREVKDFIEKDLGEEGLKRSILVIVTAEEPALRKIKGAQVATTIAEYFRDQGANVLLMMDSLTRFCMAIREVGLATGEPPTSKGYPPSVFAALPSLLERTGKGEKGSISAFYTVLVDGDDFNEPISDAARSILDGHIVLTRQLAAANHYPAIDILESISRLAVNVCGEEEIRLVGKMKELLSVYEDAKDLINIGAYVEGSNPVIDESIKRIDAIRSFLKQGQNELISPEDTWLALREVFKDHEKV